MCRDNLACSAQPALSVFHLFCRRFGAPDPGRMHGHPLGYYISYPSFSKRTSGLHQALNRDAPIPRGSGE